ncbi:MAG: DoxX family protein [Saprospiraceae bacterium]
MMQTIYWVSTLIITGFLALSSYTYFFSAVTIEGVKDLGFPDFFRIQLGVLKVIAIALLLLPNLPTFLREWAYAGVGLFLLTAFVAHIAHKDSVGLLILLLFLFAALAVSRYTLTQY